MRNCYLDYFLSSVRWKTLFDRKRYVRVNESRNIPGSSFPLPKRSIGRFVERRIVPALLLPSFYVISVPILTRYVPARRRVPLSTRLRVLACMSFANRPINTNLLSSRDCTGRSILNETGACRTRD